MSCGCVVGETHYVNDHITFLARVVARADGTALLQSEIASIAYTVERDGVETVASTALTITSVINDTLQTNALWTVDATGYNFKVTLDHFQTAGTYKVKVRPIESGGAETTVAFGPFPVES